MNRDEFNIGVRHLLQTFNRHAPDVTILDTWYKHIEKIPRKEWTAIVRRMSDDLDHFPTNFQKAVWSYVEKKSSQQKIDYGRYSDQTQFSIKGLWVAVNDKGKRGKAIRAVSKAILDREGRKINCTDEITDDEEMKIYEDAMKAPLSSLYSFLQKETMEAANA